MLLSLLPVEKTRAQAPGLRLPFPAGTTWRVVQGYHGGTHTVGAEQYALDLVRVDGPTAGTEVLAPAAGTLWWMNPPGAGNGCVLIKLDGGSGLIAGMCHVIAHSFRVDERVEAGQSLGRVGPDGTVGNNGMAHLHFSLHRTPDLGVTRIPAPFAPPDGLPLEGLSLPADGSANHYACPGASCRGVLVSTNVAGSSSSIVGPPVVAVSTPVPLGGGMRARITGGGCLNIRERPALTARVLSCLADGTLVTVADGPVNADGHIWWRLDGLGWAAGAYLTGVGVLPIWRTGAGVIVDAGEGDCLNLREAPSLSAPVLICLPSGARLTITGGPRQADGHVWWLLDGRGWAAAAYLRLRDE